MESLIQRCPSLLLNAVCTFHKVSLFSFHLDSSNLIPRRFFKHYSRSYGSLHPLPPSHSLCFTNNWHAHNRFYHWLLAGATKPECVSVFVSVCFYLFQYHWDTLVAFLHITTHWMIVFAACQVFIGHLIPVLPGVVFRSSSFNSPSFLSI